jgi:hypothetical protein
LTIFGERFSPSRDHGGITLPGMAAGFWFPGRR